MEIEYGKLPFAHLICKEFLTPVALQEIKEAVLAQPFERKSADLFELDQTIDLTQEPAFAGLREKLLSLATTIRAQMGADVKSLDMSAMRYHECDYLLCHDDQLEGRKIAYILYLSSPQQGGELLFRNTTAPYKVEAKISPVANTLVLFEVSEESWHEVAEVIKGERLSVGGWFH